MDLAADAVVVAMGVPVEGEQAVRATQGEFGPAQRDMVLAADIGRPGDVAVGEGDRRSADSSARARSSTESLPAPDGPMT